MARKKGKKKGAQSGVKVEENLKPQGKTPVKRKAQEEAESSEGEVSDEGSCQSPKSGAVVQKANRKDGDTPDDLELRTFTFYRVGVGVSIKKIRRFFSEFGEIENVKSSLVMAVKYLDQEDACKAGIAAHGAEPFGPDHTLSVRFQTSIDTKHSIFVTNLPVDVTRQEVENHFSVCGPISHITMTPGDANIRFKDPESVTKALSKTKFRDGFIGVKRWTLTPSVIHQSSLYHGSRPFHKKNRKKWNQRKNREGGDAVHPSPNASPTKKPKLSS